VEVLVLEISDDAMLGVRAALDGVAARQRIIAQNIANAETPGYIASTVTFEDSLREALENGRPRDVEISTGSTSAPAGANGNNVQLDQENVALIESGLRFQLMTEAMNNKYQILRASMRRDS
jgi:flagellar basal-body rod protein FlgB